MIFDICFLNNIFTGYLSTINILFVNTNIYFSIYHEMRIWIKISTVVISSAKKSNY